MYFEFYFIILLQINIDLCLLLFTILFLKIQCLHINLNISRKRYTLTLSSNCESTLLHTFFVILHRLIFQFCLNISVSHAYLVFRISFNSQILLLETWLHLLSNFYKDTLLSDETSGLQMDSVQEISLAYSFSSIFWVIVDFQMFEANVICNIIGHLELLQHFCYLYFSLIHIFGARNKVF